jgi:hypothetical protein
MLQLRGRRQAFSHVPMAVRGLYLKDNDVTCLYPSIVWYQHGPGQGPAGSARQQPLKGSPSKERTVAPPWDPNHPEPSGWGTCSCSSRSSRNRTMAAPPLQQGVAPRQVAATAAARVAGRQGLGCTGATDNNLPDAQHARRGNKRTAWLNRMPRSMSWKAPADGPRT